MKINPRIFGALLVGAGLIAFAYFVAPDDSVALAQDPALGVVTAKAPERTYIEIKDSDNDGIADWKEQFQHTAPIRVYTGASSTKATTSVDTLTGQIAVDLFKDVIDREAKGPYGVSRERSLYNASSKFAKAGTDTLYTASALTTSKDFSITALHTYGNNVAAIIAADLIPEGARNELEILTHATQIKNKEMLLELEPIVAAYKTGRDTMLTITVPETMTREHLYVVNAYEALMIDTEAMQEAFTDPLYTMTRLKRYHDDVDALHNAIIVLYQTLHEAGVRWNKTDTVSKVITVNE